MIGQLLCHFCPCTAAHNTTLLKFSPQWFALGTLKSWSHPSAYQLGEGMVRTLTQITAVAVRLQSAVSSLSLCQADSHEKAGALCCRLAVRVKPQQANKSPVTFGMFRYLSHSCCHAGSSQASCQGHCILWIVMASHNLPTLEANDNKAIRHQAWPLLWMLLLPPLDRQHKILLLQAPLPVDVIHIHDGPQLAGG